MTRITQSIEAVFAKRQAWGGKARAGVAGRAVSATMLALALLWSAPAYSSGSQSTTPPPAKEGNPPAPATPSAKPTSGAGPDSPPAKPRSLDDLLGVPGAESGATEGASDAAEDEQAKRLQRSLDEASLDDLVARAIDGMKSASQRLDQARDPGIGTQRIQEDVVRTLDRLLEEAGKQQKRKSSSSSSRRNSEQRGESGENEPSQQNGQQSGRSDANQSGEESQRSKSNSDSNSDSSDGTRDDVAAEAGELDETRIEWGRLPERVRELVLQGRRDRVSTIYERLTREYYRRLAEEASK